MKDVNERLRKLDEKKSALLAQINDLNVQPASIPFPNAGFQSLSFDDKKKVAKTLIIKVPLTRDEIKIQWVKF